jgi:hypothetical protein
MPTISFAISPAGLRVPVMIGLNAGDLAKAQSSGTRFPPPTSGIAEVDTGSNVTAVSQTLIQPLGVSPTRTQKTQTISGQIPVNRFRVSLSIFDPTQPGVPMLTDADLEIMELPNPLPGVDALIGMDLLIQCKFTIDGPGGTFSFDF